MNAANYAVGLAVAIILIFKKDFVTVFYISGMTSNECLFVNMILFQAGLVLLAILLIVMNSAPDNNTEIVFPLFYEFVPILLSGISIYYAFTGDTAREKIVVIICAVLYSVFSAIIIYSGSRLFQLNPKKKK